MLVQYQAHGWCTEMLVSSRTPPNSRQPPTQVTNHPDPWEATLQDQPRPELEEGPLSQKCVLEGQPQRMEVRVGSQARAPLETKGPNVENRERTRVPGTLNGGAGRRRGEAGRAWEDKQGHGAWIREPLPHGARIPHPLHSTPFFRWRSRGPTTGVSTNVAFRSHLVEGPALPLTR